MCSSDLKLFPKLNHAPLGFDFNEGYLLFGWGARSFGAADSTAGEYGAPLSGVVEQKADKKRSTLTFTFPGRAARGMKIFVSTWDGYLGEFRGISDKKEDWEFYTLEDKDPATLSKIFDHALVAL